MTTLQTKSLWINNSLTCLTTSSGAKTSTPEFFYKSQTQIDWHIRDANGNSVDLSAGTFEFKVASDYNGTTLLSIGDGYFDKTGIATGDISCIVDLSAAQVGTLLDKIQKHSAQCSLWCTIAGSNYLLASFEADLYNTIY